MSFRNHLKTYSLTLPSHKYKAPALRGRSAVLQPEGYMLGSRAQRLETRYLGGSLSLPCLLAIFTSSDDYVSLSRHQTWASSTVQTKENASPSANAEYHHCRKRPARPCRIPLTECRLGCQLLAHPRTAADSAAVLSMKNKTCRSLKISSPHVHATATSARSSRALMCCYCFSASHKSS